MRFLYPASTCGRRTRGGTPPRPSSKRITALFSSTMLKHGRYTRDSIDSIIWMLADLVGELFFSLLEHGWISSWCYIHRLKPVMGKEACCVKPERRHERASENTDCCNAIPQVSWELCHHLASVLFNTVWSQSWIASKAYVTCHNPPPIALSWGFCTKSHDIFYNDFCGDLMGGRSKFYNYRQGWN